MKVLIWKFSLRKLSWMILVKTLAFSSATFAIANPVADTNESGHSVGNAKTESEIQTMPTKKTSSKKADKKPIKKPTAKDVPSKAKKASLKQKEKLVFSILLESAAEEVPRNVAAVNAKVSRRPQKPVAEKIPHLHDEFSIKREDPYFWMRERENPKVLDHLAQENAYASEILKPLKPLEKEIFQELKKRVVEEDRTVPVLLRGSYYFLQYSKGKEFAEYRRQKQRQSRTSELLLDLNERARKKEYYQIGSMGIAPNSQMLAFSEDTVGRRFYSVYLKDLKTNKVQSFRLEKTSGDLVWAEDNLHLFVVNKDEQTLRPYQVVRLNIQTGKIEVVYEEKDESYLISLDKSAKRNWVFLVIQGTLTTEYRMIPAQNPLKTPEVFEARERGHFYQLEEGETGWWVRTNWKNPQYRLMQMSFDEKGRNNWKEKFVPNAQASVENLLVLEKALVTEERKQGLVSLRFFPLKAGAIQSGKDYVLESSEVPSAIGLASNLEYGASGVVYSVESPIRPREVREHQFQSDSAAKLGPRLTDQDELLKATKVPGYKKQNYQVLRKWYSVRDGEKVPVTILTAKKTSNLALAPLFVEGYGAYGISSDPVFISSWVSLLDRGFVVAVLHIRGGGDLGQNWYEAGRLKNKKNTFNDFIDCTEALLKDGYGDRKNVFAFGGSAGGLLMGAVANMRPDLYKGIVALVPFVDTLTTMLDDSLPLTVGEYTEWGNPKVKEDFDLIKSYSPYDNVKAQNYPAFFVKTGFHDSQVQYWEPMKWVARLREKKTDRNPLLFVTEMSAGHSGKAGRFQKLQDSAQYLSFVVDMSRPVRTALVEE